MTYYQVMMNESAKFSRMNFLVGLAFLIVGLILAYIASGFFLHGLAALLIAYSLASFRIAAQYRQLAKRYQSRIFNR